MKREETHLGESLLESPGGGHGADNVVLRVRARSTECFVSILASARGTGQNERDVLDLER